MKILIDGDSCPKIRKTEITAKEHGFKIMIFADADHEIYSSYSQVIKVGNGQNAADFELIKYCNKGDLVITGDYGLAAMVLAKQAKCMHPSGYIYTNEMLLTLLMQRDFANKIRKSRKGKRCTMKCLKTKTEYHKEPYDVALSRLLKVSKD